MGLEQDSTVKALSRVPGIHAEPLLEEKTDREEGECRWAQGPEVSEVCRSRWGGRGTMVNE